MLRLHRHPSLDQSAYLNMSISKMELEQAQAEIKEDEEDTKIPDESRISKALSEQI